MKTVPRLKLTYFDGPGRAELIRLIFAFGNVPFEDNRIGGEYDPVGQEAIQKLKPSLPLGQVPVLEVDGVIYAQSIALARYAAKLSGLYPHDPLLALRVDMISDTFRDIRSTMCDIKWIETNEAVRASKTKKFMEEMIPTSFTMLDNLVQGPFFLGEKITYADVELMVIVNCALKPNFPDFSSSPYIKLENVIANVKANPNIVTYLAKQQTY